MSQAAFRLIGHIPVSYTSFLTPDKGPCAVQKLQGYTDFESNQEHYRTGVIVSSSTSDHRKIVKLLLYDPVADDDVEIRLGLASEDPQKVDKAFYYVSAEQCDTVQNI